MRASVVRSISFYLSWLLWAFLLLLALTTSAPGNRTIWSNWYTLLVSYDQDISQIHEKISGPAGPRVISAANAEARFQGFPELQGVTVRELPERLDPEDPRLDPYLRSLPHFFTVRRGEERYHLLLIDRDRSPRSLLAHLRSRLGGGVHRGWPATGEDWIFVDALGANSVLIGGLFLLWAGGVLFFFRSNWLAGVPLLLSFLPAVATGAPGTVAAGLLLFALLHVLKSCRRELRLREEKSYRRVLWALRVPDIIPAGWSLLSVGILLLAAGEGGGVAIRVVGSFFLALLAILLVLVADYRRYVAYEHHPFTATSILTRRFGAPQPKPGLPGTLWGSGGLLLVVLVSLLVPPVKAPPVPAPSGQKLSEVSYEEIAGLFEEGSGDLPNVASYVAHRAFQESILYGGTFDVPVVGEEVVLPTYEMVEGRLRESREAVLRFDQQWLEETLEGGAAYPGVQTVLLSEDRLSGVEYATFDRLYLSNFRPAPLAGALLVAFSPFVLFGLRLARNVGVRSTRGEA
ncbi:MAG: hypothetical protein ACOC25_04755 [Alkalispirochaetaceae bacterium]